jgi:hypothetical protein
MENLLIFILFLFYIKLLFIQTIILQIFSLDLKVVPYFLYNRNIKYSISYGPILFNMVFLIPNQYYVRLKTNIIFTWNYYTGPYFFVARCSYRNKEWPPREMPTWQHCFVIFGPKSLAGVRVCQRLEWKPKLSERGQSFLSLKYFNGFLPCHLNQY